MKSTNIKLLSVAILLFGIAILISSFKKPEETAKEYLTLVLSRGQGVYTSGSTVLATIPETGPPDITELEGGSKKDALISNAVSVNSLLNSYAKKGFRLVSSVCDQVGAHGTTYFYLEKN